MSFCSHVSVFIYKCVCSCVYHEGQKFTLSVFLDPSLPCFLRQGLSLTLGQPQRPSCLYLPSAIAHPTHTFPVNSRDLTSDPHAEVEGHFPRDHLLP